MIKKITNKKMRTIKIYDREVPVYLRKGTKTDCLEARSYEANSNWGGFVCGIDIASNNRVIKGKDYKSGEYSYEYCDDVVERLQAYVDYNISNDCSEWLRQQFGFKRAYEDVEYFVIGDDESALDSFLNPMEYDEDDNMVQAYPDYKDNPDYLKHLLSEEVKSKVFNGLNEIEK